MSRSSELRIALVTDVHYADIEPEENCFYRESLAKLTEAAAVLAERRPHLAVSLGDLIDSPPTPGVEGELAQLRTIDGVFKTIAPRRAYALGNHCVAGLSKKAYLETVGQGSSHFSLDLHGWRLVFLDGCFRADGVAYDTGNFHWTDTDIPASQRAWLRADLAESDLPAIVFCHQRLDTEAPAEHRAASAEELRAILAASGRVKAVFMGHSHENKLVTIQGIPYATLSAMVEGSGAASGGYSLLTLSEDGALRLEGFRRHAEHPLAR